MFARARRDEAAARATGDLRLALRALRESRALPSSRRSSRAPSVPVQPDVEGDPTWRAIEITRWGWRVRETAHELTLEASLVAGPVREFVQRRARGVARRPGCSTSSPSGWASR